MQLPSRLVESEGEYENAGHEKSVASRCVKFLKWVQRITLLLIMIWSVMLLAATAYGDKPWRCCVTSSEVVQGDGNPVECQFRAQWLVDVVEIQNYDDSVECPVLRSGLPASRKNVVIQDSLCLFTQAVPETRLTMHPVGGQWADPCYGRLQQLKWTQRYGKLSKNVTVGIFVLLMLYILTLFASFCINRSMRKQVAGIESAQQREQVQKRKLQQLWSVDIGDEAMHDDDDDDLMGY
jgi:hypothetical protein